MTYCTNNDSNDSRKRLTHILELARILAIRITGPLCVCVCGHRYTLCCLPVVALDKLLKQTVEVLVEIAPKHSPVPNPHRKSTKDQFIYIHVWLNNISDWHTSKQKQKHQAESQKQHSQVRTHSACVHSYYQFILSYGITLTLWFSKHEQYHWLLINGPFVIGEIDMSFSWCRLFCF